MIFEPTCAYARWALMRCFLYVCLSGCDLTKIHLTKIQISATVKPRVIKFGQNIDMDDPRIDLAGQGHRSKVKVARSKNIPGLI